MANTGSTQANSPAANATPAKTATAKAPAAKATPATKATPAPRRTRTTPATTPAPTPTATIRTMIIVLPEGLPRESLTTTSLDRHFGVPGSITPRFWATPALRLWQRGQMIGLRKGRPASCAGGPVRLLDLVGLRHAAGVGAGIRHQLWTRTVHGTRPATPWHVFWARHLADPQSYPFEAANADFNNQTRVNAMRMHNAVTYGAGHLDIGELEIFQAGQMAYQHHTAATAVCGDALLSANGNRLAPASDAMAHRVTYLQQANHVLETLEPDQCLLAVTL